MSLEFKERAVSLRIPNLRSRHQFEPKIRDAPHAVPHFAEPLIVENLNDDRKGERPDG